MVAEPAGITDVIAQRVKQLRTTMRLSGPSLAERMVDLGLPWNRTTVAKLETGRRASLTVQELLALALVLGVPPVWLLADPASTDAVPVTDTVSTNPWSAMLWAVGREPLTGRDTDPGPEWNRAEKAVATAELVVRLVLDIRHLWRQAEVFGDALQDPGNERERQLFTMLAGQLDTLARGGFELPVLPDDVRARALALEVELQGGR